MYKCHLCDLQTKQLNGLMSRHHKQHISDSYSKEKYKADVLAHNGRPLKNCEICGEIVPIPKGEAEPPRFHKSCYTANLSGRNNPNYKGGLIDASCAKCNKPLQKHKSHLKKSNKFCSASCSMNWYAEPENRTEKQIINDKNGKLLLEEAKKTDKFKIAHANALAKMQKERTSKLEIEVIEKVRKLYPLAEGQIVKDFYTVDLYIPEIDTYLDVHGNYWHNKSKHQPGNKRKRTFFHNKGLKYLELWGNEIDYADDLVAWASKTPSIYILCGPSGAGKTWLADRLANDFNIIDMDRLKFDECVKVASMTQEKSLVVINTQATRFVRELAEKGIRCSVAVINEDESVIKHRISLRGGEFTKGVAKRIKRYQILAVKLAQFAGTQSEVFSWLKPQL
jgi:hypothetical protein